LQKCKVSKIGKRKGKRSDNTKTLKHVFCSNVQHVSNVQNNNVLNSANSELGVL